MIQIGDEVVLKNNRKYGGTVVSVDYSGGGRDVVTFHVTGKNRTDSWYEDSLIVVSTNRTDPTEGWFS